MKYICRIHSTAGAKGAELDLNPDEQRTQQLLANGVIAESKPVKPAEKKGGSTPKDAGQKAEVKSNAKRTK